MAKNKGKGKESKQGEYPSLYKKQVEGTIDHCDDKTQNDCKSDKKCWWFNDENDYKKNVDDLPIGDFSKDQLKTKAKKDSCSPSLTAGKSSESSDKDKKEKDKKEKEKKEKEKKER